MAFIFAIFYFLLIAPMRKKQKATQEMISKLKKGEDVFPGILGYEKTVLPALQKLLCRG